MDWKSYEEVTKYIYETIGKSSGVTIECFGSNCKVLGKSNVSHQIDVLTNFSDGLHNYKTAIECKYWNKNINKDIVMKVAEIVEDAKLNKGIIVSKLGFTPDAINVAKYKNIGLVELREPTDKDWEGKIRNIHLTISALMPEIANFEFIVSPETKLSLKAGKTLIEDLNIEYSNGKSENLKIWIDNFNSELAKQPENEFFEKIYKLEENTKVRYNLDNSLTEVKGFKFGGYLRIGKSEFEIDGEEHIYMIMKLIFEEKSFTLYKNGELKEN